MGAFLTQAILLAGGDNEVGRLVPGTIVMAVHKHTENLLPPRRPHMRVEQLHRHHGELGRRSPLHIFATSPVDASAQARSMDAG